MRTVVKTDLKKIIQWNQEACVQEAGFFDVPEDESQRSAWMESFIKREGVEAYVVMSFLLPVGFVTVQAGEKDTLEVRYLVDPEYREEHLGRRILTLLEEELCKAQAKRGEDKKEIVLSATLGEDSAYLKNTFLSRGYETEVTAQGIRCNKKCGETHKTEKTTRVNSREPAFEILRVVAMLMVLTLHYLDKGGILKSTTETISIKERIPWFLESLCSCAVNLYVLIGSYFLVDKKFHFSRVARLWCEVIFYSVGITIVCLATGFTPPGDVLHVRGILFMCMPGIFGHYWFASAYILLLLISPFLNKAVHGLSKKQYRTVLMILVGVFSLAISFSPYKLEIDDAGVSVVWFVVLYLLAGYIKRFGIPIIEHRAPGLFVASVALTFLWNLAIGLVVKAYPEMEYALVVPRHNNFIFVLLMAVSLFCSVRNVKLKGNILVRGLVRIAPFTFGVYLIHEHLLLRYEWMNALTLHGGKSPLILHYVLTVGGMFLIGICIDAIRSLLFTGVDRLINWGLKLYFRLKETFDYLIAGGLTTVVNWIVYALCAYVVFRYVSLGDTARIMISNVIAWIAAVLFAYVVNRTFVFHSQARGVAAVLKEFGAFLGARIFSFAVEQGLMFLMVEVLKANDLISKLLIGIIVIVMNYIFSKLFIFRKKEGKEAK
ncbi:MAG: GtrA family protein [Lachnospiraceae bacterium]|nr:GtrA family protein [Lachnospiraceae bacterium]